MRSFFKRQALATAIILFCSFLSLSLVMMVAFYNYFVDRTQSQLGATAEAAADLSRAYSITGDLDSNWDLKMSISLSAQVSDSDIIVCDDEGVIVLSSNMSIYDEELGRKVNTAIQNAVVNGGKYSSFGDMGGHYKNLRYIQGRPIYSASGEVTGTVFASTVADEVLALFLRLVYIFLLVSILIFVLALLVQSLFIHKQIKPLRDVAQAARSFGLGNYSVRVAENDRKDEIGELTRAFNTMADSLEKSENLRQEFVANVSHELRTPMTTISGFIDGILDGTVPEERREECLKTVSDEVKRLSRLVVKMLEISRLQARLSSSKGALKVEDFNISEVLRLTLLGMEQKINSKKLDVLAELGDDDIIVRGEKDSLMQVVYNLLGNAVKFAREGTELMLKMEKKDGKAHISFSNYGDTIPARELNEIFERFHKADSSRSEDKEGLGLGLYIV
ncbi:MAG: HAMP domain-containing protein, partial [Oscillospiraceae bacterium]|nr:HAMP domain-containing protein [Oscillospiraceae bacterium]